MDLVTIQDSPKEESSAFLNLQFAKGEKRVLLSNLKPDELQTLMYNELKDLDLDLEHFSVFEELQSILSKGAGGDPRVRVKNGLMIAFSESPKETFNLRSHVVNVGRDVLFQNLTWRQYETGAETTDRSVYNEWGNNGYLWQGKESILIMRKFSGRWNVDDLLMCLDYRYVKIPNKNEYVIDEIYATPVPVSDFCNFFGKNSSEIACNILWELSSIYRQTADHMEMRAKKIRERAFAKERFASSIG
jgi:hypothetical protein